LSEKKGGEKKKLFSEKKEEFYQKWKKQDLIERAYDLCEEIIKKTERIELTVELMKEYIKLLRKAGYI
jgi:uncharacterized protein (DUF1778 family)